MQRRLLVILALGLTGVSLISGIAVAGTGEEPLVVRSGNLVMTLDGNAAPTKLPKYKLTPVSFHASGKIETADGSHPPALREVALDVGKTAVIKANEFPTCSASQLQSRTTKQVESICKSAIVGRGVAKVDIEFPEQPPIPTTSPLLIVNGGEKNGKILMFIHAYLTVPTPAAVVTEVTTTRIHKGVYRLHSIAKIPVIAGGAGSPTYFYLNINRRGYLWANCDNGHFAAHVVAKFSDSSTVSGSFIRPCIGT
jgi:hypothetical protein